MSKSKKESQEKQSSLEERLEDKDKQAEFYGLGEHNFSTEQIEEMMSPSLAAEKARQEKFKSFVTGILSGDSEDNSGPYHLRLLVETDNWLVPVKDNGNPEIWNIKVGEYDRLFADVSPKDGRKIVRQGQGGQFLPIYKEAPDGKGNYKVMDGRALARYIKNSLSVKINGLLVQEKIEEPLAELGSKHFDELVSLADAIEIEDLLMTPGPSLFDAGKLLDYRFIIAMVEGKYALTDDCISLATHPESMFLPYDTYYTETVKGKEIFEKVLASEDLCGVVINASYDLGRAGGNVYGLKLSLNFLKRALAGEKCSYRVPEFTTRCREEFDTWLKALYFPQPYSIVEEKDGEGRTFLHAVSESKKEENWGYCECDTFKSEKVVSPKFELKPAPGSDDELAAGPSKILCPALLAKFVFQMLPDKDRKENIWRPGTGLLVGRLLSDEDIARSRQRTKLAKEALKLIPPGQDAISRPSILSVDGARFFEWAGQTAKKQWLETALEQSRKYNKKVVIGN